jgi:hypothetical protein
LEVSLPGFDIATSGFRDSGIEELRDSQFLNSSIQIIPAFHPGKS